MNGLKRLKRLNVLTCLSLLLYWVALMAPAAAIAQSNPVPGGRDQMAAIDAYIKTQMKELRIPGLTLSIVQGDQISHLQGFGAADDTGRLLTPQTPMMLGSVSKSFTALAVMQLAEQDKIELDDPVERYLPWSHLADEAASARLTVRYLLNQTSGFSELTGNGF